jgi:hypothetical protein
MNAETKHLNPSDLSNEQLERIAFGVATILSKHGLWNDKPLSAKEAMAFTGFKKNKFFRLVNLGVIKGHMPDPDGHPIYYASEINEGIRRIRK